jgi:hypothetical protein
MSAPPDAGERPPTSCSRCLAPIPAGEPGGVVTCAYCGQQTRMPAEAIPRILELTVHVVGSSPTPAQHPEATPASGKLLTDRERRTGILIAVPATIVAIAAAVLAILHQSGCFEASPRARPATHVGARARPGATAPAASP